MFTTAAAIAGMLAAAAICGFALWRGLAADRWGAGVVLAAWIMSPLAQSTQVFTPLWAVFWIDLAVLTGFLILLARYRRLWLASASAFQALAVASHTAMMIDHRVTMNTYLAGLAIWSLAVLAALLTGAITARGSISDDVLDPDRPASRPRR